MRRQWWYLPWQPDGQAFNTTSKSTTGAAEAAASRAATSCIPTTGESIWTQVRRKKIKKRKANIGIVAKSVCKFLRMDSAPTMGLFN